MMQEIMSDALLVAIIGLLGGVALGLAARLGRFCTLGAIEDLLYGGDDLRIRMWLVALGVAIFGTYSLSGFGLLETQQAFYLSQTWNPLASIIGGLVFGYGMALAGNCGFGALARLGGGDMRSFVIVLVMGLASYVTLSGPLAKLRITVFPSEPVVGTPPGFAHSLASQTGLSTIPIGLCIGLLVLILALLSPNVRRSKEALFWSVVVGLAIVSGWAGTQWVARHGFDVVPIVSHTFSAPIGETMLYAMTSSGSSVSFGTSSVFGVLLGSFIGSLIKGHFRWEACEDPRELRRQILGACMMGFGAVVAMGCSIGQGLSAFSLLAFSAPVTLAAIVIGAAFGLRQLIAGFEPKI